MTNLSKLAIIGSGPTTLFFLHHILNNIELFKKQIATITIFEKDKNVGMGMPYNPNNTDIYNLSNISSEEIPLLQQSFADWLRNQSEKMLSDLNIQATSISDSDVYSRVALGHYFHNQFEEITKTLKAAGIMIIAKASLEIIDIEKTEKGAYILTDSKKGKNNFTAVAIANGHVWNEEDKSKSGYFGSPWPISKILPTQGSFYNFPIGTLGASLSAFDVVTSLSHRHGTFTKVNNKLKFSISENAPNFKLVLHSAEGWLPHLQYEQDEPIREIYRHFDRNEILALIDKKGFLSIQNYFHMLCKPALIKAFTKDNLFEIVEKLKQPSFKFQDFVTLMSENHEYTNSFEGMKLEMVTARNSVENNIPIHWMETLDDLMYSLNYHAELLSAEDHLFFHKEVMSFLMNVIAALPLQSAEILLALYDANCIELKTGRVSFPKDSFEKNKTKIEVTSEDGSVENLEYELFINCSGQKNLELADFPFSSLVKNSTVCGAKARFFDVVTNKDIKADLENKRIIENESGVFLKLSGIDIDASYRMIDTSGIHNEGLFDINFTHTNGLRPYSYGLQACHATSLILVESLIMEFTYNKTIANNIEDITQLYEDEDNL